MAGSGQGAREQRGLTRLEQIAYAVLERDGRISVMPAAGEEG